MALFGDVGKFFHDVIRNPVVQIVFPVAAVANLAAEAAASKALGRADFATPPQARQAPQGDVRSESNYYFPQQYAQSPAYSVYFQEPYTNAGFNEVNRWDFSISSIPFSIPLAGLPEISSMPRSQGSWEDFLAESVLR